MPRVYVERMANIGEQPRSSRGERTPNLSLPPEGQYEIMTPRESGNDSLKGRRAVWALDQGCWVKGFIISGSMQGNFVLVAVDSDKRILTVDYTVKDPVGNIYIAKLPKK